MVRASLFEERERKREVSEMVTVNEREVIRQPADRRPGRLGQWVEQDMADVLSEYGARVEDTAAERVRHYPAAETFAYGIPMAGVRYYAFLPEA